MAQRILSSVVGLLIVTGCNSILGIDEHPVSSGAESGAGTSSEAGQAGDSDSGKAGAAGSKSSKGGSGGVAGEDGGAAGEDGGATAEGGRGGRSSTGGRTNTGGRTGAGGRSNAEGGADAEGGRGGRTSTGGRSSVGGRSNAGGTTGAGGRTGTGGVITEEGGAPASGGVPAAGGSPMGEGGAPVGVGGNPAGEGGNPTGVGGTSVGQGGAPIGEGGSTAAGATAGSGGGTACTVAQSAPTQCSSDGNVVQIDSCGEEVVFQVCNKLASGHGGCREGVCGCAPGYVGEPGCGKCLVVVDGDRGNDDANSGTSWGDSLATVQVGLSIAASRNAAEADVDSCEVWVAGGTYYPTLASDSGDPRTKTILLKENVALYGGFNGTESLRSQRVLEEATRTTLSGDIGTVGNAYHVVTGATGATIDGFTITLGRANGAAANADRGAGMFNDGTVSLSVDNCVFVDNRAVAFGGAMYNANAALAISGSTFSDNWVNGLYAYGGAIASHQSSPNLFDCIFERNFATASFSDGRGGAISLVGSGIDSPIISNCSFIGNRADGPASAFGGGVYAESISSMIVAETTFTSNSAQSTGDASGGAIHAIDVENTEITDSVFRTNTAVSADGIADGGAICSIDGHATVTNGLFVKNEANGATSAAGGAFRQRTELAMERVAIALTNCTLWGNSASASVGDDVSVGGGIRASGLATLTLANSIVWGNAAGVADVDDGVSAPDVIVSYSDVQGFTPDAASGVISIDPLFVGAAAGNLRLQVGSHCVDTANSAVAPDHDVEGSGRPLGAGDDMGAYESH